MAETRKRSRSRKAQPEVQANAEQAGNDVAPTAAQISGANTVEAPVAEIDVFEGSQAPTPGAVAGVEADIDVTYISPEYNGEYNGAGGSSVEGSPGMVAGLLQRQEFVEQLVAAMFTDGKATDSLLGRLSDKLQDHIGHDPEFKRQLLASAFATPGFRNKVVKALARAIS